MVKDAHADDLRVNLSYRQIFSLASPITISILIPQLNVLINSIFLGALSKEALANAGITAIYYLVFAISGSSLNNAMQTVFSRYAGSGRTSAFPTIMSQGILIGLSLSILYMIFTWLAAPGILEVFTDPKAFPEEMGFLNIRIVGLPFLFLFQIGNAFLVASLNSRLLIFGFIMQAFVNIILDYLLIFGHYGFPKMGFNGAALASVIAEGMGMITVFFVLGLTGLKAKYKLLDSFSYHKPFCFRILKVAIPLVFQNFVSIATWLAFFLMIESKGINAKAISNTLRSVFGLAGIFIWAFASTTNVMVSNLLGQGLKDQIEKLVFRISMMSLLFSLVFVLLLNLYPELFFRLFNQDEAFVQEAIPVGRMVSLGLICMSFACIWFNAVTGTGKTRANLIIEIVSVICYIPYTWYVLVYRYSSLSLAWTNELVYWTVMFLLAFAYMKSGRWKRENRI